MARLRQDLTAMAGQAGEQVKAIDEAGYRNFKNDTYARTEMRLTEPWPMYRS